jgi:hypothetical protein
MDNQNTKPKHSNTLGFYAAIFTAMLTMITFVIAYLTEPLSGPFCKSSCFVYPFTDITSRFPTDYIWMLFAIILFISYAILMVCIHYFSSDEKKVYSHIGLLFAFSSAVIFITDFFIQLSVIQPSLLQGETEGVALLTQFNPHGIFIVLEELGYFLMSLAFLFMAPVFSGSKLQKSIRWVFVISFVLNTLTFIWFCFQYGINREYRFEVASISINWLTLIITGILLSIVFKRTTPKAILAI